MKEACLLGMSGKVIEEEYEYEKQGSTIIFSIYHAFKISDKKIKIQNKNKNKLKLKNKNKTTKAQRKDKYRRNKKLKKY